MAHVSFANARIESVNDENISTQWELNLRGYSGTDETYSTGLCTSTGTVITTNHTNRRILNTPSRLSILLMGIFTTSGTEAYIYNGGKCWKLSNISFQDGDDYSFIVDVDMNPS